MPRGRFLSKSISLDEKVNALSNDTARLLFTWLIPHLDCEGRMHGDATTVKSIVFPRRPMHTQTVERYLKEMEELGLIVRYSANGTKISSEKNPHLGAQLGDPLGAQNTYLFAPNFEKHQAGLQKSKEAQSQIPPFTPELLQNKSRISPPQVKVKVKVKDIYIIPKWIDKDIWNDFLEMRGKMRKPPTEKAKRLLIKDLERLRSEGHNPNEVLNQSIMRNYTGVFPLKGGNGGAHRQSPRALRPRDTYTKPEDY